MPETMPAYGELRTDRTGRLWVQETLVPPDTIGRFTAFDRDGRMLGTITLPPSFRVLEFGDDYVLGVAKDELEVEQLRLYRLVPAGA